jgi:hypothetical protein
LDAVLRWRCVQALAAAGVLLKEEKYAHKYPYDWRTKKPTIFRATDQVRPLANSALWSVAAPA